MKVVQSSGTRKQAIARATIKPGKGNVRVNNIPLAQFGSQYSRMRIEEPLRLAGATASKVDVAVTVHGGGATGQADAARLAVARALAEQDKKLKDVFLNYDRQLLVADVRYKETSKPNSHGKARAKRQKSYR